MPEVLNPNMTLSGYSKRMKLAFSSSTATCVLSSQNVDMLPPFNTPGLEEIDGSGLISRPALNLVWEEWCHHHGDLDLDGNPCPFTGFQGRIGGLKGVWVLDDALGADVTFQCRLSQLKYHTVLTQRTDELATRENPLVKVLQRTVDVVSWDDKKNATMNTRIIQVREVTCF